MYTYAPPIQPTKPAVAQADNLTIAAFILVFFMPLVGAIMGHVSRHQAKRAGMRPSALATWAVGLGWAFTTIWAVIAIALAASVGAAVNTLQSGPPVTHSSCYPNCGQPSYTPPSSQPAAPPVGTVSERNALRSARGYLAYQAFSRKGLIKQLSSKFGEGYPRADAVWAVKHLHANWNAQAVKSAREYLKMQGFSRAGLIKQLDSPYGEQFTVAQATYAANKVGL